MHSRVVFFFFFFSSRRRHTRCREVSWARRCVQETVCNPPKVAFQAPAEFASTCTSSNIVPPRLIALLQANLERSSASHIPLPSPKTSAVQSFLLRPLDSQLHTESFLPCSSPCTLR
eukprot:TRINITY_DN62124_c0_g1_i1.p2 TRINITY_DN62124_c0_g1~~TRINITY_DN62124_c0_g1_i1.p2  ORF type:complete len:117 (+),score=27.88 TRINITY_DN62124_c0_g1_i1:34-384(+)